MTNNNGTNAQPLWKRWWLWLLLAGAVGAGAYFYLNPPGKAQPAAAGASAASAPGAGRRGPGGRGVTPVVLATARVGDIGIYINGLGSAVPLNAVTVKSRVDGELVRVLFHEGQLVKRGELLAEIDPRPFEVQLTQAEGQMARDQALLKNAQLDLERYRTLFQQDSIAKQQLDTQEALVRQYEAATKVDRGQIDNAKLQLTYSRVTAPIGGRLGLRQVDPGNIVRSSDANGLVVITQLQPVSVVFTMPEDSIPSVMRRLRSGEKLTVDAYDRAQKAKLASGILLTVDNQIDPTTGTVKLKAQFANEDFGLFPNQFVNTRMLVDTKRGVTIIPTAGVQRGSQGTFVYVVRDDSTANLRPVTIGAAQGDDTEIVSGLKVGERVVVEGADKLREGAKVEIGSSGAAATEEASRPRGERARRDGSRPEAGAAAAEGARSWRRNRDGSAQ